MAAITPAAKVNVATLFSALVLFLLPWTDVTCGSVHLASQSGVQATYGGVSMDPSMKDGLEKMGLPPGGTTTTKQEKDPKVPAAAIVSIALFVAICAAGLALVGALKGTDPPVHPGWVSAVALVLIVAQAILGFPLDKDVGKEPRTKYPEGSIVSTTRTPWFWCECFALAIPTIVLATQRRTKRGAGP